MIVFFQKSQNANLCCVIFFSLRYVWHSDFSYLKQKWLFISVKIKRVILGCSKYFDS